MNVREELYRSGATLVVRKVQTRRGRSVPVLDPHRIARGLILRMLLAGKTPRQIARTLDLPLATVCGLGIRAVREKKFWIKSNFGLADIGNNP